MCPLPTGLMTKQKMLPAHHTQSLSSSLKLTHSLTCTVSTKLWFSDGADRGHDAAHFSAGQARES